jgi:hypothetical protein
MDPLLVLMGKKMKKLYCSKIRTSVFSNHLREVLNPQLSQNHIIICLFKNVAMKYSLRLFEKANAFDF